MNDDTILANKYTRVTMEIGYIEDLINEDESEDLALVRKLETLRTEQRNLALKMRGEIANNA